VRWKTDDRPQRHGWARGEYVHGRCVGRELEDSSFIGAKRAIICADCASQPLWLTSTASISPFASILMHNCQPRPYLNLQQCQPGFSFRGGAGDTALFARAPVARLLGADFFAFFAMIGPFMLKHQWATYHPTVIYHETPHVREVVAVWS
jgi:hypothetical protein